MKARAAIATLSFLAMSASALAGAWVSSGGELFKDAHNAWFVRNTTQVNYCVSVGASFSMPKDQARAMIRKALDFWKSEFARSNADGRGTFKVGTQEFREVECSDRSDIDVRFLLGHETLNKEERDNLVEPRKYIGITVRTDYDEAALRGKGFVFIASDTGPNSYLNSGDLIERAWQYPKLLQYALMHETGHVFGFPHIGGGLMSEVFLEQMLNKKLYENFLKAEIESVLAPGPVMEICGPLDLVTTSWFGASASTSCLRFEQDSSDGSYAVLAKGAGDPVGLGKLRAVMPELFDYRSKPATVLQLTDKQKVFSAEETAFRTFLNGPSFADYGGKSVFVPATGAPKAAYVRLSPSNFTVFGDTSQQPKPVFLYQSGLSLLLSIIPQ